MRRGTVQVKKSAADDLRVCSEKSPNIGFERDAANSAAALNLDVRRRAIAVSRHWAVLKETALLRAEQRFLELDLIFPFFVWGCARNQSIDSLGSAR
jgi:hypothetical protein